MNLATPIAHVITPEPEPALAVLGITPNVAFVNPSSIQTITIIGTGFDVSGGTTVSITKGPSGASFNVMSDNRFNVMSDNLIYATLSGLVLGQNEITITVSNRNGRQATLDTGFTVLASPNNGSSGAS